jgi:phosphoglucomutase/phosphopentomutase
MADQDWLQLARQWIAWDVNEGTRREVQALVDAQDVAALSAMFDARIAFGTAGLRAAMAPGPAAMNDLVVIQTTQVRNPLLQELPAHVA